jgi:predicted Zn-dependent peptidase
MSRIHTYQYDNGMTLLLPAGAAHEPTDRLGVAAVLSEMIFRGAGDLDAREHSDALDRLGIHRSSQVRSVHTRIGARFMGDRLDEALPLLLDMARRPRLEENSFGPAVQLGLQSLEGLEDVPQEKVMVELKRRHLGEPLGRSVLGEADHLRAMSLEDVHNFHRDHFVPNGAILSLAGNVDPDQVYERVAEQLGDWAGQSPAIPGAAEPTGQSDHITADTAQQHIGLAHKAVSARAPETMTQCLAMAVLSGGMSGRLFTEVREKRGLCYAVYATYAAMRDTGAVFAYAGTTPQRASETLEVMESELRRLGDGVEREEFDRAAVGLKSRVVMQGESTSARAQAIAQDQYLLDRPRTLDELAGEIDAVTHEKLNAFLAEHRPQQFTSLTIGPEPLREPSA